MLNVSMRSLVISGCSVWCWFWGWMVFGFFLGSIDMYLCMSHIISVSKSCGGGCRKLVMCGWLLWLNWFHSQCNRSVVIVAMYLPFWSNTLDSRLCVCMVGLLLRMSLSGLHSCMLVCRLVILRGGRMYFLSFVCV